MLTATAQMPEGKIEKGSGTDGKAHDSDVLGKTSSDMLSIVMTYVRQISTVDGEPIEKKEFVLSISKFLNRFDTWKELVEELSVRGGKQINVMLRDNDYLPTGAHEDKFLNDVLLCLKESMTSFSKGL